MQRLLSIMQAIAMQDKLICCNMAAWQMSIKSCCAVMLGLCSGMCCPAPDQASPEIAAPPLTFKGCNILESWSGAEATTCC